MTNPPADDENCPNSCCRDGVLTNGNPCPTCRGSGQRWSVPTALVAGTCHCRKTFTHDERDLNRTHDFEVHETAWLSDSYVGSYGTLDEAKAAVEVEFPESPSVIIQEVERWMEDGWTCERLRIVFTRKG